MAGPDLTERFRRSKLEKYLLHDEKVIIAQHEHWAVLAKKTAAVVGALVVVIFIDTWLPGSLGRLTNLFWWAWIGLVVWYLWQLLEWWGRWLIATDKRLLMNHGLIIKEGVAMLPFNRMADLTYFRTAPGKLFGYGTLVREGAGHNQTLREVKWVKHPDETYRTICAQVIDVEDRARGTTDEDLYGHRFEDGPPEHAPGLHQPYIPIEARTGPISDRPGRADHSPGIRIRYGGKTKKQADPGEPWYQSADLRDSSLRDADTGPINYRRSVTDLSDKWTPTTDDGYQDNSDGDTNENQDSDDDGNQDD
jgi:hypothetical protein